MQEDFYDDELTTSKRHAEEENYMLTISRHQSLIMQVRGGTVGRRQKSDVFCERSKRNTDGLHTARYTGPGAQPESSMSAQHRPAGQDF